jgi:hypothetical protein
MTPVYLTIVATLISFMSFCFAVWIGTKGDKRTDTKDIEDRAKENARINFKLDEISNTTKEIKRDVDGVINDVKEHNKRLIIVEQSTKSAHKRIDFLEKTIPIGKEDVYHEEHIHKTVD